MSNKTKLKKLQKQFHVGDPITWGNGRVSYPILEITKDGVFVDVTGECYADIWATKHVGERWLLLVSWTKNNRNKSGRGPIRHAKQTTAQKT